MKKKKIVLLNEIGKTIVGYAIVCMKYNTKLDPLEPHFLKCFG